MADKKIIADICLYGNSNGSGYIVCDLSFPAQTAGDGTPKPGRSFTEAIWLGVDLLKDMGVTSGLARVFEPTGERMALIDLGEHVPTFGSLKWKPVVLYVVDVPGEALRYTSNKETK